MTSWCSAIRRIPSINYIKRLVGLPGDRVEVRDDHLVINGQTIEQEDQGRFTDGCYVGLRLSTETLGEHTHQVMSCRSAYGTVAGARSAGGREAPDSLPVCDRKRIRESVGGWLPVRRIPLTTASATRGDYACSRRRARRATTS